MVLKIKHTDLFGNLKNSNELKSVVQTTKTNLYILIPYSSSEYAKENFLIFVRISSQWSTKISRGTWKRKLMLVGLCKSKCGEKIFWTVRCPCGFKSRFSYPNMWRLGVIDSRATKQKFIRN